MAINIDDPPIVDATEARPLEVIAGRVGTSYMAVYNATRARNVQRLRLPHIRVGRELRTTVEAFTWWSNARAAMSHRDATDLSTSKQRRAPRDRQRSIEAAEAELDRLGVR